LTELIDTRATLEAQARLRAELDRVVELERAVRAAQAEQLRHIELARRLAADVEGVTDASLFVDREFATRSFVAELATSLVMHEATASRLVADARQLHSRSSPRSRRSRPARSAWHRCGRCSRR
jgi:hypothetical protein